MKKHHIAHATLGAYIVISAAFILYSAWGHLEASFYNRGVSDGQTSAVVQLMNEAAKCEPFTVFAGEAKVELQALNCEQVAAQ